LKLPDVYSLVDGCQHVIVEKPVRYVAVAYSEGKHLRGSVCNRCDTMRSILRVEISASDWSKAFWGFRKEERAASGTCA
jgi:hypothetical protein